MAGTLYVVATPIGNLEDITLRALRILRAVSLIAAEDTRRTGRLLQHYSISTPTTSLHEHNEQRKATELISRLRSGQSVALVSDAGTPLVSDPGARLVSRAHAEGIRVEPVPGASALMAALSAAGFETPLVHFAGFPPTRGTDRARWFAEAAAMTGVLVLYEAPHRIRKTLQDLLEALGDRPAAVGRELTKVHENLVVRPITCHLADLGDPRGEYTVVVHLGDHSVSANEIPTNPALLDEFGKMTNSASITRREAVRSLAVKYRRSTRDIYQRLERGKNAGD